MDLTAGRGETTQHEDFEGFYRARYRQVAQALYLATGDIEKAEDLVQEAMSRVLERWARVREMSSPAGYVYVVALNLHRRGLRRLGLAARARSSADREDLPGEDPAAIVATRQAALAALAALPRAPREALVLVEWLGLSPEVAAGTLGIAQATLRGRLHRARRALDGWEQR
jgi:RNA polymerase sigma-70 factor (ECF subfamily)